MSATARIFIWQKYLRRLRPRQAAHCGVHIVRVEPHASQRGSVLKDALDKDSTRNSQRRFGSDSWVVLDRGKTMNKYLIAMVCAWSLLAAPLAFAQGNPADAADMQALRIAVRADRKALVASTLSLTDAEAKKFWPIYDAYQRDLDLINRQRVLAVEGVIALDKPVSDLYARSLSNQLIAADEAEIKARRTMHNKVMRALPPRKAARYLQLESKIRAFQAYDVALAIPLVK
jgi:Spy/CpxP family protein refolding chaperone